MVLLRHAHLVNQGHGRVQGQEWCCCAMAVCVGIQAQSLFSSVPVKSNRLLASAAVLPGSAAQRGVRCPGE